MPNGKLIVISGPSGTGKTSICNQLLARLPRTRWSISATTRPPRSGEVQGQSYTFMDRETFLREKQRGAFLETAEYLGHCYGTPEAPVREALANGDNIVLEIEVMGGKQIAERIPDSVRIFVLPPTMESLRARLAGRRTESQTQQASRLAQADGEIGFARDSGCYTHFVTNDDLNTTVDEILAIIQQSTPLAKEPVNDDLRPQAR